jgi:hypothetical protein
MKLSKVTSLKIHSNAVLGKTTERHFGRGFQAVYTYSSITSVVEKLQLDVRRTDLKKWTEAIHTLPLFRKFNKVNLCNKSKIFLLDKTACCSSNNTTTCCVIVCTSTFNPAHLSHNPRSVTSTFSETSCPPATTTTTNTENVNNHIQIPFTWKLSRDRLKRCIPHANSGTLP